MQEQLEKARKRLRICLIAVVLLAIVAGCAYYFGDFGKERDVTEGTLVRGAQDAQGDVRVLYSSNTTKIDTSMPYSENVKDRGLGAEFNSWGVGRFCIWLPVKRLFI